MRIIFIILLVTICSYVFCQNTLPIDPFEEDLDRYYMGRATGSNLLLTGVIGLATSFIAGSTLQTLYSLDMIGNDFAQPAIISSYCVVSVSAVTAFIGFIVWKGNSDKYLDTLRLQANYYNLVR